MLQPVQVLSDTFLIYLGYFFFLKKRLINIKHILCHVILGLYSRPLDSSSEIRFSELCAMLVYFLPKPDWLFGLHLIMVNLNQSMKRTWWLRDCPISAHMSICLQVKSSWIWSDAARSGWTMLLQRFRHSFSSAVAWFNGPDFTGWMVSYICTDILVYKPVKTIHRKNVTYLLTANTGMNRFWSLVNQILILMKGYGGQ